MTALPDTALLSLLHLCDSAFPTGGFAHSDGLEAAICAGTIANAADLRAWMESNLTESLTNCDAAAVAAAWDAVARGDHVMLARLDEEVVALRPAAASRVATLAMGARLLSTWRQLHPESAAQRRSGAEVARCSSLPVVFGAVTASAGISRAAAVEGFIYTRLAATVSAAMRLMPLGQHEAHALLASILARVPEAARATAARPRLSCFAPALEIAQMSQQYVGSRLFRS
jgi:urease accessory protein